MEFGEEVEEGAAVVAVAGKALTGEDPTVCVAGGLDGVGKDFFVLAFVKEAAFGIGGGLCNGGGIGGRIFRWFEVVFSVCVSIVGNFFFKLLLVASHVFFHHGFFVFVAIGMGFDVGGIDELEACVDEALVHRLLKDVGEDGLKEVGVLKTPTVVLPKGGEVGDFIVEVKSQEPTIGQVDFDFFNGLAHAPNAIKVLDKDEFNEDHGVDAWPSVVWAVKVFNKIIDEVEVHVTINFPQKMICRHELIQSNHLNLFYFFLVFFV